MHIVNQILRQRMVAHSCNPSIRRLRQEDDDHELGLFSSWKAGAREMVQRFRALVLAEDLGPFPSTHTVARGSL